MKKLILLFSILLFSLVGFSQVTESPSPSKVNFASKATSPLFLEYGVPFNEGLTIVTVGTWDATIVYE